MKTRNTVMDPETIKTTQLIAEEKGDEAIAPDLTYVDMDVEAGTPQPSQRKETEGDKGEKVQGSVEPAIPPSRFAIPSHILRRSSSESDARTHKRRAVGSPDKEGEGGTAELPEAQTMRDVARVKAQVMTWCNDTRNKCNSGYKKIIIDVFDDLSQVVYKILIDNAYLRGRNEALGEQNKDLKHKVQELEKAVSKEKDLWKAQDAIKSFATAVMQPNTEKRPGTADAKGKEENRRASDREVRRREHLERQNQDRQNKLRPNLQPVRQDSPQGIWNTVSRATKAKSKKAFKVVVESSSGLKAPEIKAKLITAINPRIEGIHVRAVRQTKTDKVVIEMANEMEVQKLKANKLFDGEDLQVRDPVVRGPRVLIYDVPRDVEPEDLCEAIWAQNGDRLSGLTAETLKQGAKPIYRTGKRGEDKVHHVLEVTPVVRKALTNARRVFVGWMSCKVVDHVAVSQCFNCLRFGHIATKCPQVGKPTCGLCAKEGHETRNCPDRDSETLAKRCALCQRRNRQSDHQAGDRQKCLEFGDAIRHLKESTGYD